MKAKKNLTKVNIYTQEVANQNTTTADKEGRKSEWDFFILSIEVYK